jgi:hypothetical protein
MKSQVRNDATETEVIAPVADSVAGTTADSDRVEISEAASNQDETENLVSFVQNLIGGDKSSHSGSASSSSGSESEQGTRVVVNPLPDVEALESLQAALQLKSKQKALLLDQIASARKKRDEASGRYAQQEIMQKHEIHNLYRVSETIVDQCQTSFFSPI